MVRLRFDTDLGTSLKASNDLATALGKVERNFTESVKGAKALELAAKRITDANLSPQEKYNRTLQKHAQLVAAGKLSVDDAEKSLARYRQRIEQAGQSSEKTFGAGALQMIGSYAGGLFGVAGAIRAVTAAQQDQRQKSQEAAAGITASFEGGASLQQVATSQAEFDRLRVFSESLISRGIVEKPGPEGRITGGLVKAGLTASEMESLAKLGERDVLGASELAPFAEGAKGFQRVFGLSTFEQAASMLIEGAKTSRATPAELGQMALRFGEGARKMPAAESLASALAILETSATERQAATGLEEVTTGKRRFSAAELAVRDAQFRRLQRAPGLEQLGGFIASDPDLAAEDERQDSAGRLAIARRRRGRRETLFQSIRLQEQTVAENQNFFLQWMDWLGGRIQEIVPGGTNLSLRHAADQQPAYLSESLLDQIKSELENQTQILQPARAPRPSGRQEP